MRQKEPKFAKKCQKLDFDQQIRCEHPFAGQNIQQSQLSGLVCLKGKKGQRDEKQHFYMKRLRPSLSVFI